MSFYGNRDFMIEVAKGNIPGHSLIHKFGSYDSVSTTLVPICNGGEYQTPTSATALEVISDDANDGSGGSGARKVTIEGLDSSWAVQTEEVTMNGTTAVALANSYLRVYRMFVSESGTYATATGASQRGTITLRVSGAGATWATIPEVVSGFGVGQSLIGAYTVPAGKTAYILSQIFSVDSNKTVDLYFFKRSNANDVTTPYTGTMRLQNIYVGASGVLEIIHATAEAYNEYTDIGFMAKASSVSDVGVEFEMLLVDN